MREPPDVLRPPVTVRVPGGPPLVQAQGSPAPQGGTGRARAALSLAALVLVGAGVLGGPASDPPPEPREPVPAVALVDVEPAPPLRQRSATAGSARVAVVVRSTGPRVVLPGVEVAAGPVRQRPLVERALPSLAPGGTGRLVLAVDPACGDLVLPRMLEVALLLDVRAAGGERQDLWLDLSGEPALEDAVARRCGAPGADGGARVELLPDPDSLDRLLRVGVAVTAPPERGLLVHQVSLPGLDLQSDLPLPQGVPAGGTLLLPLTATPAGCDLSAGHGRRRWDVTVDATRLHRGTTHRHRLTSTAEPSAPRHARTDPAYVTSVQALLARDCAAMGNGAGSGQSLARSASRSTPVGGSRSAGR